MVTDRYQHIVHHPDVSDLVENARADGLTVVAVDNTPGSVRLERTELPRNALLLFGQEGPGLTEQAHEAAGLVVSIAQFGFDEIDQRRGGRRDRDARLDPPACGPDGGLVIRSGLLSDI